MSKRSFPVKLFFFSMKGKLLISSPGLLTDMIFYKSIILIVDQTDDGITGFILNRPSDLFIYKEIDSSKKIKNNRKIMLIKPLIMFLKILNHDIGLLKQFYIFHQLEKGNSFHYHQIYQQ